MSTDWNRETSKAKDFPNKNPDSERIHKNTKLYSQRKLKKVEIIANHLYLFQMKSE